MANKRQLVKRRKAVRNIRKITRTMQLIATARFQAAFKRAMATKPFSQKLAEMVGSLSSADVELEGSLFEPHSDAKRSALVVLTSKRGLCGGFNGNVLRTGIAHTKQASESGIESDVYMVGRKGVAYYKFLKRPTHKTYVNISDAPRFDEVEPIAVELMDRFKSGEITSAHVAHMRFYSAGKQRPEVMQLLPMVAETQGSAEGEAPAGAGTAGAAVQYDFSPEPAKLLEELLPTTVKVRLYQCFTDAVVSEQVARMVAMKAATDAAGDMITMLTRQYNRARQTSITMELLDIIGGAAALS